MQQWFGPHPLTALTVIDHAGQPFEDGPLLVAPVGTLAARTSAPLLAHSLTHAWVQTGQPWIDEGLAEFFSLLWIEREKGRDAAVTQFDALMQPVAAADTLSDAGANSSAQTESSSSTANAVVGQPLIAAYDELFFRRKAAAVWWMLRDLVGEQPLQLALSAWRTQKPGSDSAEAQAQAFEALLEKTSGKDLAWFFNDWVLHDRGLPSLSIVDVTPRELPAGTGHGQSWLVAVTVHNAGAAAAEVPLVIRSGTFSTTKRVRIPGLSNTTERVVVESAPTDVILNDGSTPEAGPGTHTRTVVIHHD
jgi:aminopeptidase N